MKAILSLLFLIFTANSTLSLAATLDTHCSAFLSNIYAFDFKTEENTEEPQLSEKAKDFATFSVIAHTKKLYGLGVQIGKVSEHLTQAECGDFLKTVVTETWKHLKAKTEQKKKARSEKKNHNPRQRALSAKATSKEKRPSHTTSTTALGEKVKKLFELSQKRNNSKLLKPSSPKGRKSGSMIDLTYFENDEFPSPEESFITKSSAREAVLHNWRKRVTALEAHLKKHLKGQNDALEKFCEGIFNHYGKQIKKNYVMGMRQAEMPFLADLLEERSEPSTILITGPSGTGKTEMVKLAAAFLGKPLGCASGGNLSPAGYKGDDPVDAIIQLVRNASQQVGSFAGKVHAEMEGIAFLDEIDKTAVRAGDERFKEGAQSALLTLVEGSQPIKLDGGDNDFFDPSNVLFILAGAFSDMIPSRKPMSEESTFHVDHEALIRYGLKPELVNRFKIILQTNPLSPSDLYEILTNRASSPLHKIIVETKAYSRIDISFSNDALLHFCQYIEKDGIGARNLYGLLKELVEYTLKNHKGINRVTKQLVNEFKEKKEAPRAEARERYAITHGIV